MISYRLTPWDSKAFGIKTAEIFMSEYEEADFPSHYLQVEKELKAQNIQFIYTRIDGQYFQLRKDLQTLGFYFAESSLKLSKSKIQGFQLQKLPKIQLMSANTSDVDRIQEIAKESFYFGRFHEDVYISKEAAKMRYVNWIADLVKQQSTIQVAKVGETIIGFNIQQENLEKQSTSLLLTGCDQDKQLYVLSLWNALLDYNKSIGVREVNTLISAANVGVFNVYNHFGFKVRNTLFGFHKWL